MPRQLPCQCKDRFQARGRNRSVQQGDRAGRQCPALVKAAQPEISVAHLPLDRTALGWGHRFAESLFISGDGLLVMCQGLGVGRHPSGLIAHLEEIVLCFFPIAGRRVMVGQQTVKLFQAVGKR